MWTRTTSRPPRSPKPAWPKPTAPTTCTSARRSPRFLASTPMHMRQNRRRPTCPGALQRRQRAAGFRRADPIGPAEQGRVRLVYGRGCRPAGENRARDPRDQPPLCVAGSGPRRQARRRCSARRRVRNHRRRRPSSDHLHAGEQKEGLQADLKPGIVYTFVHPRQADLPWIPMKQIRAGITGQSAPPPEKAPMQPGRFTTPPGRPATPTADQSLTFTVPPDKRKASSSRRSRVPRRPWISSRATEGPRWR